MKLGRQEAGTLQRHFPLQRSHSVAQTRLQCCLEVVGLAQQVEDQRCDAQLAPWTAYASSLGPSPRVLALGTATQPP